MEDTIQEEIDIIDLEIAIIEIELEIIEFENEEVSFSSNYIQCNICGKTFSAVSTLKLHKEIFHADNKQIASENKVNIENLKGTVNFMIKPIQCNICLKKFSATSTLNLHIEIHHANYNKTVSIEIIMVHNDIICDIGTKQFEKHFELKKQGIAHASESCVRISLPDFEEQYGNHKCERDMKTYCPKNVETDFCDIALAWEDKCLVTHKTLISQKPNCWSNSAIEKVINQNFMFQVF